MVYLIGKVVRDERSLKSSTAHNKYSVRLEHVIKLKIESPLKEASFTSWFVIRILRGSHDILVRLQ